MNVQHRKGMAWKQNDGRFLDRSEIYQGSELVEGDGNDRMIKLRLKALDHHGPIHHIMAVKSKSARSPIQRLNCLAQALATDTFSPAVRILNRYIYQHWNCQLLS